METSNRHSFARFPVQKFNGLAVTTQRLGHRLSYRVGRKQDRFLHCKFELES